MRSAIEAADRPNRWLDAPDPAFIGRRYELEHIESCAARARVTGPCVLHVVGEEGVGKTELLRQGVRMLDDFWVLFAACDEAEHRVPFGVLSQLVEHLPADVHERHVPWVTPYATIDPAGAGADLCRALVDAHRPVALVVDDVQHADAVSLAALGVAVRQIAPWPVLVLLARRTADEGNDRGHLAGTGVSRDVVYLTGLNRAEVGQLAAQLLPAPLHGSAVGQLHEYSGGNPLRATALLTELQPDDYARPRPFTSSRVLRHQFGGRLAGLPRPSADLLDALAVLNVRCRLSLPAQLSRVTDAVAALEPLLDAGLVRWWPAEPSSPVELCDVMCREAVYSRIGPQRRRALHRRAAALVDRIASWAHRVAAATGPDPALAGELEREAAVAVDNRDEDHAATCLLWAADLSDTRADYERRVLTGVSHLLRCPARRSEVDAWVAAVDACAPSALRLCVQGELALGRGELPVAEERLAKSIRLMAGLPAAAPVVARAAATLATALIMRGEARSAAELAELALAGGGADALTLDTARCCQVLGTLHTEGPRAAVDRLTPLGDTGSSRSRADLLACRAVCRFLAGELTTGLADARAAAQLAWSRTTDASVVLGLYLLGGWDQAEEAARRTLAEPAWRGWLDCVLHMGASVVAAGRGDTGGAVRRLGQLTQLLRAASADCGVHAAIAEASIAQAAGDFSAMVAACEPIVGRTDEPGGCDRIAVWQPFWLPLYVEGLIGCGRLEAAATSLSRLAALCGAHPHLRIVVGWLSGWLAAEQGDLPASRVAYEQALAESAGPDDVPLYRARLEQAYGTVLIRTSRRRAGISSLRRAQRRYLELGAQPFLTRCMDDLARIGLRGAVPSRDAGELTRRERQIVELVVEGMTNREVAARLFVTEKTIEYHLGNVFARLGISSRRDLRTHPALRSVSGPSDIREWAQRTEAIVPNMRSANADRRSADLAGGIPRISRA